MTIAHRPRLSSHPAPGTGGPRHGLRLPDARSAPRLNQIKAPGPRAVSRRVVGREAVEEARPRVTAALPPGRGDVSALHLALRAAR